MSTLVGALLPFAAPAALFAAGFLLVVTAAALPPSLVGLTVYGPYLLAAAAALLALSFGRGRALAAIAVLSASYGAHQLWLASGVSDFTARTVYAALLLFVPLDLAALACLPERGIFNRSGALRFGALGAQALFAAALVASGASAFTDWAYRPLVDPWPFGAPRMPQLGIAALAAGLALAAGAALVARSALSASLAGAIASFAVAAHVPTAPITFGVFTAVALLMVGVGVLQDAFHMAFRDELTGLPSRRALAERLVAMPRRYTVAMVDVDHFKQFNDSYGHELGDQVLKAVASHLARVGGGGRAFRYGGEEFAILFPGVELKAALPHLEALRQSIEAYRIALRAPDRPRKPKGEKRRPGGWRDRRSVSVTVSIGVAERNERLATAQAVLEAADRALYRAKEKGRNQVSR